MRPAQVDAQEVFTLTRMEALLHLLGNPHRSLTVVHVAGSKGKGSVCEMTAAALQGCGCSVGLYISPHLVDIRERIRVGGAMIPREQFAAFFFRVLEAGHELASRCGPVTHFEALTAMAFLWFAEQAVDVAVVEVGLGGRLDATNVVRPVVTAITAIQGEHIQFLGPTLLDVARHKAGIFKPGVPAITLQQDPAILTVLAEEAARVGTVLHVVGGSSVSGIANTQPLDFAYRFVASSHRRAGDGQGGAGMASGSGSGGGGGGGGGPRLCVSMQLEAGAFENVPIPLSGEHQAWNGGVALAILDVLRQKDFVLPESRIIDGLAATPRAGRLEMVMREPRVYIDGAHNPESIASVVKALGTHTRYDSLIVVFGCAADKDVGGMLTSIGMGADKIVFTKSPGNVRAMDPKELSRKFLELTGKNAQTAQTVKDAVNLAARAMGRGDVMLITGSFLIAGEAKRLIQEKLAQSAPAAHAEFKPAGAVPWTQGPARTIGRG
jgi:dihydrofolate synthase / folylpolyglutamate synthase